MSVCFFFSSRRRHTRFDCDWSSDVCSSDLLSVPRKTVAGHVSDPRVVEQVATWTRAAAGWAATRSLRLARFGDNMRYVAVTEGDKTEAEAIFGVQVNTWGVNDLVAAGDAAAPADVDALVAEYEDTYDVASELRH